MTDPKEVADLVARLDRFLSGNFYAPPVIREALEASSKTLETLSSELERVKGERDEARLLFEQGKAMDEQAMETGLIVSCIDHAIMRARAERAEASLGVAVKALEPFADFAERNTDDEGWAGTQCQRERVCDWFGPSDFRAARSARASIQAKGE
jgi:hypothetical protein